MRLHRPYIPVEVKCLVVLRQLGEIFPGQLIEERKAARASLASLLATKLAVLAELLGCQLADLQLDHNPALGAREKRGEGKDTIYKPAANDPEYLFYRPQGPEFAGSHAIKTNVRGDAGQYPDRVLIKRARRRARKPRKRVAVSWRRRRKRAAWPKRRLRSASRWPPKGSRKINWRRAADPRQRKKGAAARPRRLRTPTCLSG